MDITLTKDQLRNLLILTYIGNWVVNADKTEKDQDQDFNSLEQVLLAQAKNQGLGSYVLGPDQEGSLYASEVLEETAETYLDEFERGFILEDLALQLARRDLLAQIGPKKYENYDPEHLAAQLQPFLTKYMDEFDANGVENLRIIKLTK
jgi:hypothetical protein